MSMYMNKFDSNRVPGLTRVHIFKSPLFILSVKCMCLFIHP